MDGFIRPQNKSINYETLNDILRIIDNPEYRYAAQQMSELHRAKPMHPLESTIFWIENTIKTHGAYHLRKIVIIFVTHRSTFSQALRYESITYDFESKNLVLMTIILLERDVFFCFVSCLGRFIGHKL